MPSIYWTPKVIVEKTGGTFSDPEVKETPRLYFTPSKSNPFAMCRDCRDIFDAWEAKGPKRKGTFNPWTQIWTGETEEKYSKRWDNYLKAHPAPKWNVKRHGSSRCEEHSNKAPVDS